MELDMSKNISLHEAAIEKKNTSENMKEEHATKKENKVRAAIRKDIILIFTESASASQIIHKPGEEVKLTAREIFEQMSSDPSSIMPYNPTAKTVSFEEKRALDELFSLFKDAALNVNNITVAKNCMEILSSPFGLLHPRRNEAIGVLKKATGIPELASFTNTLIIGSKEMLNNALIHRHTDKETKRVAIDLLKLLEGSGTG